MPRMIGGAGKAPEIDANASTPCPTESGTVNESELPVQSEPAASDVPAPSDLPRITADPSKPAVEAVSRAQKREYPRNASSFSEPQNWTVYETWLDALKARREAAKGVPDMADFTAALIDGLISENGEGNIVCSPSNIYMALSMLAAVTDGETRDEIVSALGASDIDSLLEGCAALMDAESVEDGVTTANIANSLWINSGVPVKSEPLERLARELFASSYSGDPATPEFKEALVNWIDENTGGLLKDSADAIEVDPSTVLMLASTMYFKSRWETEFDTGATKKDMFLAPDGEVECDFMHGAIRASGYVKKRHFAASAIKFKDDSGCFMMLLPDEGYSIESMLEDGGYKLIGKGPSALNYEWIVNYKVPKLDVSFDKDIRQTLVKMGVKSCFGANADFSPITDSSLYASGVSHAARVKTDEEGVEAAAYTVIPVNGGAFAQREVDFVVDRPFVFVVYGQSNAPLFVGVVNQPGEGNN